ncbi:CDP-glycerol glycerophosphotransferase family protein [Sporosarcina sp. G11-34]|uniref:CDP-glycerol glycerophosphotransferase family protein n=1 Tax=Sporosarcina sp. G11-34 TaxID=2849605 RepID=UPI0022A9A4C0|nr:CDP-glycerol glycerophosphotransferase family protein [Sporosarcina sp. G11-34]MCZ2258662.1 CDP-glycerol glycerophosphotransferase family protein [Sporosarcina sp. G11-34]
MLKEFLIAVYLLFTKIVFVLCKLFPVRDKYVMVSSYRDNIESVAREILGDLKGDVVILTSRNSNYSFDDLGLSDYHLIHFDSLNVIHYIKSIFHLATARTVFVDNYFAFLSVMDFKSSVECIQLWHAAGAVKKFGMANPNFYERPAVAQKRFLKVYDRFDKVVVGSDEMIPIFKQAFNLTDDQFLTTGIPRTDFFFDEAAMDIAEQSVLRAYPEIGNKKVVLYAPTFRWDQLNGQDIPIDIESMTASLGPEYLLFIRMHPAVKMSEDRSRIDGVIDVSGYPNVNELLLVTDYLITDYSSLPYEFALLNRPQIFYPYDLEEYEKESGFWGLYEESVPGPVVRSTDEIIQLIENDNFNFEQIHHFSSQWNKYSLGKSSGSLVEYLHKKMPS